MTKKLIQNEKISIQYWTELNQRPVAIVKRMNRRPTTISRYLYNWEAGLDRVHRGNNKKLSEKDVRQIRRSARTPGSCASSIKKSMDLKVYVSRIR